MELPQYMFHLLKKEGFLACIIVMPSVYPPGNERIYVVDALRGFAVMAIMLLHFLEHFIYNSYPVASSPMMEAANQQFKEVFFSCLPASPTPFSPFCSDSLLRSSTVTRPGREGICGQVCLAHVPAGGVRLHECSVFPGR